MGSPEPSTTAELYEQAMANREQFWKELDDLEKVVGGEWDNADERVADTCLGKLKDDHYYYEGTRIRRTPVEDMQAAGDAMQKYLDGLGYTTQQTSYAKSHLMVAAKDLNGWEILFITDGTGSHRTTSISAQTGCFRGDPTAVFNYEVQWDEDHPQPTPSPTDEQAPPTK